MSVLLNPHDGTSVTCDASHACNALDLTIAEGNLALNCSAATACYGAAITVEEGDRVSSNTQNVVSCTEANSCEHLTLDVRSLSHSSLECHDCSYAQVALANPLASVALSCEASNGCEHLTVRSDGAVQLDCLRYASCINVDVGPTN